MHLFKTQLAARQIINSLNFLFENCDFIKDFQFFGVALSMVLLLSLGMSSQWKSFNYFHPRGCGKNYDGNVSRQPHICGGMNHVVKYQWQSPKVNVRYQPKHCRNLRDTGHEAYPMYGYIEWRGTVGVDVHNGSCLNQKQCIIPCSIEL